MPKTACCTFSGTRRGTRQRTRSLRPFGVEAQPVCHGPRSAVSSSAINRPQKSRGRSIVSTSAALYEQRGHQAMGVQRRRGLRYRGPMRNKRKKRKKRNRPQPEENGFLISHTSHREWENFLPDDRCANVVTSVQRGLSINHRNGQYIGNRWALRSQTVDSSLRTN